MKNKAIVLHHEFSEMFRKLTVEEAGIIIKAVFEYDVNGTDFSSEDRLVDFAFGEIKRYLDSNRERYEKISRVKSENAKKQWEALAKAKKAEEKMELQAVAINENENINENEIEIENVNVNVNENETLPPDEGARKKHTHSQPKPYGEFANVFLTDEQLLNLKKRCNDAEQRIDSFSAYLKSSGKLCRDHYAQLINWRIFPTDKGTPIRAKPPGERREPTFDVSAFTSKAVGIKYEPPT